MRLSRLLEHPVFIGNFHQKKSSKVFSICLNNYLIENFTQNCQMNEQRKRKCETKRIFSEKNFFFSLTWTPKPQIDYKRFCPKRRKSKIRKTSPKQESMQIAKRIDLEFPFHSVFRMPEAIHRTAAEWSTCLPCSSFIQPSMLDHQDKAKASRQELIKTFPSLPWLLRLPEKPRIIVWTSLFRYSKWTCS